MVVEMLTFAVTPAELERWLAIEEQVWSRFLEDQPGFVAKQMWLDPDDPGSVHAVIWWESMELWKQISAETVAAVDARMGDWYREATMRTFKILRDS